MSIHTQRTPVMRESRVENAMESADWCCITSGLID